MSPSLQLCARFSGAAFLVAALGLPVLADERARLPRPPPAAAGPEQIAPDNRLARLPRARPRQPQEAESEMALWAEGMESRFRAAVAVIGEVPSAQEVALASAPTALAAIEGLARIPQPRPAAPSALLALAPANAPVVAPRPDTAPAMEVAEDTACLARLEALNVKFTRAEPIEDGLCRVPHPLKVSSLGSGVAIVPDAILNCRTAEALARWTKDVLRPSARELLGATPTKIVHASTYVCRNRNNDPDAKLSEHAFANAVDISAIAFAEREPLNIASYDMTSKAGLFQVAIRGGSCDHFTTVLGPRSNAAHATHFHFDMAQRSGGYRLCDLADTNFVGDVEP